MDFEWSRRDDKHVRVKERPVLDPNARPILSDFRDELAARGQTQPALRFETLPFDLHVAGQDQQLQTAWVRHRHAGAAAPFLNEHVLAAVVENNGRGAGTVSRTYPATFARLANDLLLVAFAELPRRTKMVQPPADAGTCDVPGGLRK